MDMQTTLEQVLKEDLMRDIVLEEGFSRASVPLYKKIAGIPNIGKTFFRNGKEVAAKNQWA